MPTANFSSRYNGYAYNLGYVSKCAKKGNGLNKSSQIKNYFYSFSVSFGYLG